jgi:hypothetical protein
LAPHRPGINLAIELQPGNPQLPYLKMYNMSLRESEVLKEWITEHLAKGHIQESTSPVGASIVKTYQDIQVFIRFYNFYRCFIYQFSQVAKPILLLLKGMKKGRKPGLIGHK